MAEKNATLVVLHTTMGDITVRLYDDMPVTAGNFEKLVRSGFYDGTIFHRVIDGFMIQGGGFTPDMTQKNAARKVDNEARNGLRNERGTLAMARTAEPHSASSQFFINHRDNAALNYPGHDGWGYAVFGRVTQGMDVVDAIAKVSTGKRGMHQNVPLEPIVIQSVKILSDKK